MFSFAAIMAMANGFPALFTMGGGVLATMLGFWNKPWVRYLMLALALLIAQGIVGLWFYHRGQDSTNAIWLRKELAVTRQLVETTDEARQAQEGRAIRLEREKADLQDQVDAITATAPEADTFISKKAVDAIRALH